MPDIVDIEDLISAAQEHGLQSEPDHEVGDLQEILRTAWELLPENKRGVLIQEHSDKLGWLE